MSVRKSQGPIVRIETTAKSIPVPWREILTPYGGTPMRREIRRGTPRLVVDIPVRLGQTRLFLVAFVFVLFALQLLLVQLIDKQLDVYAIRFSAGMAIFILLIVAISGDIWSSREIIEVDPRFVTVSRAGGFMSFSLRSECTEIRMNRADTHGMRVPRVVWGGGGKLRGSAGTGLTDSDAEHVVAAIESFLTEYPPETGFDYLEATGARASHDVSNKGFDTDIRGQ